MLETLPTVAQCYSSAVASRPHTSLSVKEAGYRIDGKLIIIIITN